MHFVVLTEVQAYGFHMTNFIQREAVSGAGLSLDFRTRTIDDVGDVDAHEFHRDRVPALLEQRSELATAAFAASGLDSITIAVDDAAYTWRLSGSGSLEVVPGDLGRARAELSAAWFSDIVNDVRSTVALMIDGSDVMARGRIVHLTRWEPVLRALVDGRPAYEPGLIDFADRDGSPLDLNRSFTLADDPAEPAHFLAEAGFLHLRGVFTHDEMDVLSAEIDRWRAEMDPDDKRAWFATVDDGQVCVRVTNLGVDDVEFPHAERLAPIAELMGDGHRYRGTDLLVKPVGVSEGISDLPWHKDCALGLHSYRCAGITCGVSVTGSGPDNGHLGVLAGSHRVNMALFELDDGVDLPQVFLTTEPGDVTVHVSCALHCATPPVHSERRVTYSSFSLPGADAELYRVVERVRDQAGRDTYAPS